MDHHDNSNSKFSFPTEYKFMNALKKIFQAPHDLLYSNSISFSRKRKLLKKWRDERTKFVYENYRDHDYMMDKEMANLVRAADLAKAIIRIEQDSGIVITIAKRDNKDEESDPSSG